MKITYLITVLFLAVISMSCNRSDAHDHDNDHVDNLQLTSYNDDFEVFAEA